MAETIDSLLVALGLDTDTQSFQRAESQFASVRRSAMSLAGTIGAGLGFKDLTMGVAGVNDKLGLNAQRINVSARQLDSLGYALQRAGGDAEGATGLLDSANKAIDQLQMGQVDGFSLASRWGLDPDSLQQSQNGMQFILRLADQLDGKTAQAQRNILDAFGLGGDGVFNLMTGGRNGLEQVMQQAQELSPTMEDLVVNSREFNTSLVDLERSVRGVTNILSNDMIQDLTEFSNVVSQWLTDNRGLVSDVLEKGPIGIGEEWGGKARDWLKGMLPEGATDFLSSANKSAMNAMGPYPFAQFMPELPALSSSQGDQAQDSRSESVGKEQWRAWVSQAEKDIGAPAGLLWAQIGQESSYNPSAVSNVGAQGLAQIMPTTEASLEKRFGRDLDPFNPADAIMMQKELMRENYASSGNWDEALRMYHGGWDRSQWGEQNAAYAPSIRARMGEGSVTNNNTFNINGGNPDEIQDIVMKSLRRSADQTRQDTANEVY